MSTDLSSIVKSKDGRIVGKIENKVFIKELYGNKHMLRKPIAWAIDCDIFDRVIKPLCYSIHIIDKDTGHRYIVGVETFKENCHKINRKFGDQYYLELIYWSVK